MIPYRKRRRDYLFTHTSTMKKGTVHSADIEKLELLMDRANIFIWEHKGTIPVTEVCRFHNTIEDALTLLKENTKKADN